MRVISLALMLLILLSALTSVSAVNIISSGIERYWTSATAFVPMYCITLQAPSLCPGSITVSKQVSGNSFSSTALPKYQTIDGAVRACFRLTPGPGAYKISVSSCPTSCGDNACTGDELAQPPDTSSNTCAEDCGCARDSNGIITVAYGWNGFQNTCASPCQQYPTQGYNKQECLPVFPTGPGEYSNAGSEVCQNQGLTRMYCVKCGPGLYFNPSTGTCIQPVISDGWCRWDYSEPLDINNGGSVSNPDCGCNDNSVWDPWESCSCADAQIDSRSGCPRSCQSMACNSPSDCTGTYAGYDCSGNCCVQNTPCAAQSCTNNDECTASLGPSWYCDVDFCCKDSNACSDGTIPGWCIEGTQYACNDGNYWCLSGCLQGATPASTNCSPI